MANNILDTKTMTFSDIIGNGKRYSVPLYQRDYSWKEENWEELWLDILNLQEDKDVHYMGSVVLQNEGDKSFRIIDGQQRIATISILILAALKIIQNFIDNHIDVDDNTERKSIIMNTFLGSKDAVSLTYNSKLMLNENNNGFYQTYLLQLNTPLNTGKFNDSEKLMIGAFKYYLYKLEVSDHAKDGIGISKFVEKIVGDKLLFIQITVDDELSAYTVFETLNARGLELTSTDLLKNYLFSLVTSKTDLKNLNHQWVIISKTVGIKNLPQFLRYYLNSKQKLVRADRLFKEIKNQIKKQEQVFPLLNELERYADVYVALADAESDLWKGKPIIKGIIEEICLFNSQQHKSLLMGAYFRLDETEFLKVLRIIRSIVFRYTVISGFNTNNLEDTYNKVAILVSSGQIDNASAIFKELAEVYISDEEFKNNFATKAFETRNSKVKKVVRYIFASLENQQYQKSYPLIDVDATIEHILPENPSDEWLNSFEPNMLDSATYRIGNLTLLEDKLNKKEAENKSFEQKKEVYEKSQFNITTALGDYENWDFEKIRFRQQKLANIAVTVWKISY